MLMSNKTSYHVTIIGGTGRVGLPLSLVLAKRHKVLIIDKNQESLQLLAEKKMPFREKGAQSILKKVINKTLFLTSDLKHLSKSRFIIIAIGTETNNDNQPDYSGLNRLLEEIVPFLGPHQSLILRSTLLPGTTKRIQTFFKKKKCPIHVSYCPERIAEGNAIKELESLPQIIASFHKLTQRKVASLFRTVANKIIFLDPLEAELTKLFTNAYRYIHFSIPNQFYMISGYFDADFEKIYEAMTDDYPRTKTFPKPGFTAGPCLFKDTIQLSSFTNNTFWLGYSAMLVNENLPSFIIKEMKKEIKLLGLKVGLLGMTFKADIDDPRASLSFKLKKQLEIEGAKISCSDPYLKYDHFVSEKEILKTSDIVIICVPHSQYQSLKLKNISFINVWKFQFNIKKLKTKALKKTK